MPVLKVTSHKPPVWLPNGHLQTIYPALFRIVKDVSYQRERIITPDHDFLDLDWAYAQEDSEESKLSKKLVILSHGLEGDSSRQYIVGMVRLMNARGYDCLAWNFRSCGGEMNQTARFYHSGATEDLEMVIQHALSKGYQDIQLLGFSLGGNLTLKYLGEKGRDIDPKIKKSVVFSVPMDLKACSLAIIKPENRIYQSRFLKTLKPKVNQKAVHFPAHIDPGNFDSVHTLYDFDHLFTAPLHGFDSADHYYESCSAMFYVSDITIPTLIVNAANDPIVPWKSLPMDTISQLDNVFLEITSSGGHCGFRPAVTVGGVYWSESRALEFIKSNEL